MRSFFRATSSSRDAVVILSTFLPLILLLLLAGFFPEHTLSLSGPFPVIGYLQYRAPFLLLSADKLLMFLAVAIGPWLFFVLSPRSWKKTIAAGISFWYLSWALGFYPALSFAIAAFLLWATLVFLENRKHRLIAVGIIIVALYCTVLHLQKGHFLSWALFAQFLFGLFSTWKDHKDEKPLWQDTWLLWCGLPCGFASIWYSHKDFAARFLEKPYREIACSGVARIYWGLSLVVISLFIEHHLYPVVSGVRATVTEIHRVYGPLHGVEMLGWALTLLVIFVLGYTGSYQVLQGVTRLFGYNVEDQVQRVWLSRSFLDFWKRGSFNTRQYMLRYIFFPTYFKKRNLILSTYAVWAFHSWEVLIARQGLDIYWKKPGGMQDVWLGAFTKFILLYGTACAIELKFFSKPAVGKGRELARRILLWCGLVAVLILGNELMVGWYISFGELF